MKAKNAYKEGERIELTDKFRKNLFQKLFKTTSTKFLASKLHISRGMLYHYKNKRVKTIPLALLEEFIKIVGISKQELKNNIIRTISSKDLRRKGLNIGRKLRIDQIKLWKEEIPDVENLVEDSNLNLEKWFKSYQRFVDIGARQIKAIKRGGNKIIVIYTNYARGEMREFRALLPAKIRLDKDFQYFFGLWCGDRVGGSRLGIVNKQEGLIRFADWYLKKIYQKPQCILLKSKASPLPKLEVRIDKIIEVKNTAFNWVLWVFSTNGILKNFFNYLFENLDRFLNLLPNKNIFFAGLFDAEGNVFLEDRCFRWACKDREKVKIYRKYLSKMGLFRRYDGCNLVTYNINAFSKLILPYMRHEEKVNKGNLLCFGKGKLDERFKTILKVVKENKDITIKKLAQLLKKKKMYSQIKFLERHGYVRSKGYPKKIYITQKGLKELTR